MAQHLKQLLPKQEDQSPPNPHKCWMDMVAPIPPSSEDEDKGFWQHAG